MEDDIEMEDAYDPILLQNFIQPKTLKNVRDYLDDVLENFGIEIYNIFPVIYKNFIIYVEVRFFPNEDKISIVSVKKNSSGEFKISSFPCLVIDIYERGDKLCCTLETINSNRNFCSIPKTRSGTWLVEMANALIYSLKINNVRLQDVAKISCSSNGFKESYLFLIRLFQGKFPSWYVNFGYKINFKEIQDVYPGYNYEEYINDANFIWNYPLDKFIEVIGNSRYNNNIDLFNIEKALQVIHKNRIYERNETFGEFMNKLWINNCKDYQTIEFNILDDSILGFRSVQHYPWHYPINRIFTANNNLIGNISE